MPITQEIIDYFIQQFEIATLFGTKKQDGNLIVINNPLIKNTVKKLITALFQHRYKNFIKSNVTLVENNRNFLDSSDVRTLLTNKKYYPPNINDIRSFIKEDPTESTSKDSKKSMPESYYKGR